MRLYYEPRNEAMKKMMKYSNEPEMSEYDSAFLCGLIEEKHPKKIVEIGVAAGGTTTIISECIRLQGLDCEMYSVDLCEMFYRKDGNKTGFLAKDYFERYGKPCNHKFLLGKYLPEVIDEIGIGIDFVILDTVHYLPGELLDFIAILPYLSNNATVVLHDVAYHSVITHKENKNGISTQVLLDVASGDVVFNIGEDRSRKAGVPNIAAICINEDTKENIDSVFRALLLPWYYMIDDKEYDTYLSHYKRYYDEFETEVFHKAREINQSIFEQERSLKMPLKERIFVAARALIKGR